MHRLTLRFVPLLATLAATAITTACNDECVELGVWSAPIVEPADDIACITVARPFAAADGVEETCGGDDAPTVVTLVVTSTCDAPLLWSRDFARSDAPDDDGLGDDVVIPAASGGAAVTRTLHVDLDAVRVGDSDTFHVPYALDSDDEPMTGHVALTFTPR